MPSTDTVIMLARGLKGFNEDTPVSTLHEWLKKTRQEIHRCYVEKTNKELDEAFKDTQRKHQDNQPPKQQTERSWEARQR